jgi:hypothetical protein
MEFKFPEYSQADFLQFVNETVGTNSEATMEELVKLYFDKIVC